MTKPKHLGIDLFMENTTETVKVRITANQRIENRFSIDFCGVKIAVAFNRDSGARVGHAARMVSGDIGSGGSRANWYCWIAKGSVFETEVSKEHLVRFGARLKRFSFEAIDDFSKTKESSDLDEKIIREIGE